MASKRRGGAREPRCPICRGALPEVEESAERGPKFAPMCSLRCKRIDLATWLGEGYRIAAERVSDGAHEDGDERRSGDER